MALAIAGFAGITSHSAFADDSTKDGYCDPYKNYSCLDSYLGTGILERFFNYQILELGHGTAPADPNAPSASREGWPRTPMTVPPGAYTEWPTGALTSIGVTRPNSADSPLMVAIADTDLGKWMSDNHIQVYGWVNPGANISTNSRGTGANSPVAYSYSSNTVVLDQAVLYIERLPDTVQTDHIDWGFRLSGLYGIDYRYTNSYGIASWQFNGKNLENGYDFPMMYADVYIPWVMQGLEFRIGRYISIPDIEAQLAPNNLTYTHSLTYAWDNYTNTGIVGSLQVTKNLLVQLGVTDGTETPLWNNGVKLRNAFTPSAIAPEDLLYPGSTYLKDPGNQPSLTACVRYVWNDGWDTFYPCVDGLNNGKWGYNNIQWHGFTYYHKFNEEWNINYESYYLTGDDIPNSRNPMAAAIIAQGGTPFSPQNVARNAPSAIYCGNVAVLTCEAQTLSSLLYTNYKPDSLNQWTLRLEYYDDINGWRTGTATEYFDTGLSWQHWLSPQIEMRPEITYWRSLDRPAFNGNPALGIPGSKDQMVEFASDLIIHF
jgi:Putative beta-barrel porin-2, OmpL-like. bbp2